MKVLLHWLLGLFLIIFLFLVWAIWIYTHPVRSEDLDCYLGDSICMHILYYDRPDINRSHKSLYFTNSLIPDHQQTEWKNEHIIYSNKLFGEWQDCKELDSSTLICSFQSLSKFEKDKCIEMSVNRYRYPLSDWQLKFIEIKVTDPKNFKYMISEVNPNFDLRLTSWKAQQEVNADLWVYC